MKKKGAVGYVVVTAVIVVIVVAIGGIIIYETYIGPDAAPNWLLEFINKYQYGKEWKALQDLQKDVNAILEAGTEDECRTRAGRAKDSIGMKIQQMPENAEYMLNRFTNLLAEARANGQFCIARVNWEQAEFDGTNPGFLDEARQEFDKVEGKAEFQAVIRAKEYIERIDKIKDCDFEELECQSATTKNYCVNVIYPKRVFGIVFWSVFKCKPAICKGADEELCEAIANQNQLCYLKYGYESSFDECGSCADATTCADYGLNKEACLENPCEINGECVAYKINYRNYWTCREEGSTFGIDCKSIEECEDYEEVIGYYPQLGKPYYRFPECINDVCNVSGTGCNTLIRPSTSDLFRDFFVECVTPS